MAVSGKGVDVFAHRVLGLSGESGELANRVKKIIRDSGGAYNDKDKEFALKKLGDVLYYLSVTADYFGLTLDEIALFNRLQSQDFKNSKADDRTKSRS
ncbi:hypothetical protein KA068_01730 [Candidatus Saccharibacteria bacterium]|nr:hypothetical protein [Candidatus Saccharibacteria bacterium]